MAIEDSVKILNNEFSKFRCIKSTSLKKTVVRELHNKSEKIKLRLKNKGGIDIYPNDWSEILSCNETYFFTEYNAKNIELHALFRESITAEFKLMSLHNKTHKDRLQDENGNYLEDFRYSKRLVFSDGSKVSSWSNIVSLSNRGLKWSMSLPYTKHLYNSRLKNISESMYGENIDPVKVEDLVLEKGFGKFIQVNRAYFFAKFENDIGYVPGKNGQKIPTKILKVQVDRVPRPMKILGKKKHLQGFFFKMHGYPISDNELKSDSGSLYSNITSDTLVIPT
ncbi:hypothetical protein [Aeromonas veronii]|uniref:hypothetical protein n=1 Tax=Aeromonas veronii TaxID=654 RepID=UPI001268D74F|nr:hypothetical protein [Aeromonas veronii]QMS75934.1 hypothetical protein M001_018050 [Aeromonas veronii Hm21]